MRREFIASCFGLEGLVAVPPGQQNLYMGTGTSESVHGNGNLYAGIGTSESVHRVGFSEKLSAIEHRLGMVDRACQVRKEGHGRVRV